jgi:ribonucleoside-diphosphate reductase alpha chain
LRVRSSSTLRASERDKGNATTAQVVAALTGRKPGGGTFHIEDIQNQVELALMRAGDQLLCDR